MSQSPPQCNCQQFRTSQYCPLHGPPAYLGQQWYPSASGSASLYLPSGDPALEVKLPPTTAADLRADQPFVGFRAWRPENQVTPWRLTPFSPLRYLPSRVLLHSLTSNGPDAPWNDPVAHASCRYAGASAAHHLDQRSPVKDCACGLYTWRTAARVSTARPHIWGAVCIWGRVLEHDEGFRSEHAKIICFADNGNEITEYAARERGIPVVPADKVSVYAGEFGRIFS